ncbi:MAG: bifunctional folylpolyglutamate synthase/dihydrofolate synthase [Akkermansiaceae bacterium]
MTYQESIEWLYSTQQFGIKLGLDQPRKLLRETLSFPQAGTKVIHVAGTNGKGSTCAMINSLAMACGMRTGLFTSPHLIDYRERIQVNNLEIPEEKVAAALSQLREQVASWEHHPTFFELTLALAMRYFREEKCELIILETGMGGRLDATTAVPADLAVITPIAMDHSQWLGETLSEVATEKAGIIVPKKPVISSQQAPAAQSVIEQTANELLSPLEFVTTPLLGYSIKLSGAHQQENAHLAVTAAHTLGMPLTYDVVQSAMNQISWPGRFEHIPETPFILDGAHNPHAAKALVETWKSDYPQQRTHLIFGAVEGKNTDKVLAILASIAQHIHLTPIDSPRSLTLDELVDSLPEDSPPHTLYQNLDEALAATAKFTDQRSLVTGSLFLVGQAKAKLSNTCTRPSSQ